MKISFFRIQILMLFLFLSLSSCIKSDIKVNLKESDSLKGLSVQKITFDNNQITVTGHNLSAIKNVKIKDGSQVNNLSIVSKNSTTLILSSLAPIVLNAEKLMDLIFSSANASVVQPIEFSLCQATLSSIKFDCSVPPNQNEVLSYDSVKGWTPKSMNGMSYKGTWNPTTTPIPTGSAYNEGDFLLVAATVNPYLVGDWLVSDGTSFEHVSNSSAIVNVFGRTGAVVPQEGDYVLTQLDDVIITSPSTNQVLTFNGTNWVNATPASGGGGPTTTTGLPEGSNLYFTTARALGTQIGSVTPSNNAITSTDTIKSSLEKLQGQVSAKLNAILPAGTISDYLRGNNTYSDFSTDVRSTQLTSLPSISNPIITSTDTISEAFEKLHAPLVNLNQSALTNLGGSLLAGTISGIPTPFNDNDAVNKKYVDDNIGSGGGLWQTNSTDVYRATGKVGIGNGAPAAVLDVSGDIVSRVYDNSSSSTFDFSRGNIQYTTASCSNYSISNLQNGGNYQIIIQGTTAALCNFSSTQSLTFRFYPDNDLTTANTHSIYSLTRVGNFVYVSWITGI